LVVNQLSSASAEEAAAYRKTSDLLFANHCESGSATQPDVSFEFIYPSSTEKQEASGPLLATSNRAWWRML
jgi:hypothetical protein